MGFFVTTFALDVPAGVDAMFSFVFDNGTATPAGQDYRALLFVNGWQYGKVRSPILSSRTTKTDRECVARGEHRPAGQVPRPDGHPGPQREEVRPTRAQLSGFY